MKKAIIIMLIANKGDSMKRIFDELLALPYDNLYVYPIIDKFSKDNTEQSINNLNFKSFNKASKVQFIHLLIFLIYKHFQNTYRFISTSGQLYLFFIKYFRFCLNSIFIIIFTLTESRTACQRA